MAVLTRKYSTLHVLSLTFALAAGLATPALAQDGPLAVARDLYASARYDEALAMLNGVRQQESANPINLRSIEQYRSLCLLALGRGAEAEAAIAVVVASDPMYQPTETEASPRVRTAFSEVRQRQLPDIARTRYASAKSLVRQEGLFIRRTAVPRAAPPDRRSRHGRTAGRSAHARVGLCRSQRGGLGASARAEARTEARRSCAAAAHVGRCRIRRRSTPRMTRAFRRQRRSGRKCLACRCRSSIRPASGASST